MPDATSHKCRRFRQPANFRAEDVHQLGLGVRAPICEGMLDVFPYALVGVELGSVGRKGNEMQTRRMFQKFLYVFVSCVHDPAFLSPIMFAEFFAER